MSKIVTDRISFSILLKVIVISLGAFVIGVSLTIVRNSICKDLDCSPMGNTTLLGRSTLLAFQALLFPLFEELIFRLPLVRSNKKILIGVISSASLFIICNLCYDLLNLFILSPIIFYTISCWSNNKRIDRYMIYIFVILFALMHNATYARVESLTFHSLIILTYVFMGSVFTHIRLKFGFVYCLVSHILVNSIPVIFGMIMRK